MLGQSDDSGEIRRNAARRHCDTESLRLEVFVDGKKFLARAENLSRTGIFVLTSRTLAPGSDVQILIGSTETVTALRLVATVVHAQPHGFGARFAGLGKEGRAYLDALIERLTPPAKKR